MNEYDLLDDKHLFDKIEQATLAERLTTSPEWKLLDEVRKRAIDRWIDYFIFKMDTKNIADVEMVRAMIAIWKYDLFKTLNILKQEGEIAFEELNYSGKIRPPVSENQATGESS